jgi:hypothetical protein
VTPDGLLGLGLLAIVAPAMPGIAVKTKSLLTGRRGPPVLQLYADLAKLARKGRVYSRTTTLIFRAGPVVALASLIVAALFLPLDGREAPARFAGDMVAFAGLLALGRFALVLAAMDTGSSFEGLGASRDDDRELRRAHDVSLFHGVGARSEGSLAERHPRGTAGSGVAPRRRVAESRGRQLVRSAPGGELARAGG